jgi:hypothetical protein
MGDPGGGDMSRRVNAFTTVWRRAGYGAGGALILMGLGGLIADAGLTDPLGWALWFGGLVVVHDMLLVPLVLLTGAATGMLREPFRSTLRIALTIAATLCLVALPMVSGIGRRADDPSLLPLPYGRNLVIVLGLIALAATVAATVPHLRGRRPRR